MTDSQTEKKDEAETEKKDAPVRQTKYDGGPIPPAPKK